MNPDRHARTMLPIPDRPAPGLTTYDAKDPDTSFPPIEPLLPPDGAPNVLVVSAGRRRLRRRERVRRAMRHAHGRTPRRRRTAVQPVPHHRTLRSDAAGAAHRPEPSLGRHGEHHRARDIGTGQQLGAAEHQGSLGDHAEAQRLLDRPVRQVPRGAGVAVLTDGTVRCVALGWRRIRDVLRLHRRREQPVGPRALQRHHAHRATGHSRRGLPPDRGPHRPRHQLGAAAEGADARQAVLHLLRPRCHPRPPPRPEGVDRPLPGRVRRRLGRPARDAPSPGRRSWGSSRRTPS